MLRITGISPRTLKDNTLPVPEDGGRLIVLTASRAEMADYGLDPFIAFVNTFPHRLTRKILQKHFIPRPMENGQERFAIYGIRKIESLLVDEFGEENVAVAHPDTLHQFIGPKTRVLGISTMDPVGLAYVSTTYNSLIGFGGDSMNAEEFRYLLSRPAIKKYRRNIKIIVGGQGVWQIRDSGWQDTLGIDYLFHGEAEEDLIPTIKAIIEGKKLPKYINAKHPDYSKVKIPTIKRAASYGMVEITRGCGRGCAFCTPTMKTRLSLPLDHIMKEVAVNVRYGSEMIFLATEDLFLWNTKTNFVPDEKKIHRMLSTIASYPGVKYIQVSHTAIAPILANKKAIEVVAPILLEKTRWTPEYKRTYKQPFITTEVGIESGSPRIMEKYMRGKALPLDVRKWPEIVVEGIGLYNDYDWWPLCTLMTGLPGETEADLTKTLELVDDLMDSKTFLVPLLFIPLEDAILGKERRVDLDYLSELQWEFITRCWKHNIDFWAPQTRWYLGPLLFGIYWMYTFWKHGPMSMRPFLKMMGFPERFVGGYIGKECQRHYCLGEKNESGSTNGRLVG